MPSIVQCCPTKYCSWISPYARRLYKHGIAGCAVSLRVHLSLGDICSHPLHHFHFKTGFLCVTMAAGVPLSWLYAWSFMGRWTFHTCEHSKQVAANVRESSSLLYTSALFMFHCFNRTLRAKGTWGGKGYLMSPVHCEKPNWEFQAGTGEEIMEECCLLTYSPQPAHEWNDPPGLGLLTSIINQRKGSTDLLTRQSFGGVFSITFPLLDMSSFVSNW